MNVTCDNVSDNNFSLASNTSVYGSGICDGRPEAELYSNPTGMILDTIVAAVSVVINVFHVSVLVKFYADNNNLISLINLAVNNLLLAATISVISYCPYAATDGQVSRTLYLRIIHELCYHRDGAVCAGHSFS